VCAFKMGNGIIPFPEDNFSTKDNVTDEGKQVG
jgi:hypothetical protein